MLCEGKWMKHDEIMLIEMIPTAQAKMKTRGPKTSQDVTVYDHQQQIDHVRYEVWPAKTSQSLCSACI